MKVKFLKKLELDDNAVIIDLIDDCAGDQVVEDIYLQVDNANGLTLTVSAQIENSEAYEQIGVVSLKTMQVVQSVTSDGIYVFNGTGLSGLKLTAVGDCDIAVKVLA